jgi:hypothetical protein
VPYRPALVLHQRTYEDFEDAEVSYRWIIDSLCKWFGRAPFNRLEYCQWTMATLIECMQTYDLGRRLSQFRAASRVLDDLLRHGNEHDLCLLRSKLACGQVSIKENTH